ncbi:energy-coupling factor transporter transmembrane protein EcfT [Fructobacillus sp. W13]|uniref:Energy-coupling factor transporter transmembrane protein EcfT n=1 Tax=Fructobacillus apis TaxID=2935017 RepID=A0ABT0ZQQ4_9LACO|nr:energy-coupling factor transporter transmembrane component T [Fructobacillus apis]MCO0832323.1 energy-coupling factor transporter transmembrane protein EcfT [Fructobacillus apis]
MMNASQRLYLAILLSFEVALTRSLTLNLALFVLFFSLLLFQKVSIKRWMTYLAVATLPTLGTFWSFYLFGVGDLASRTHFGLVMGSRILLFILISAWLNNSVTPTVLLQFLQQNLKLSATFTYGILAALNFVPRFKEAFKSIQAAGLMRGEVLTWYTPSLYFKAIVQSINWSEMMAMAMTAHGFQEGASRSALKSYPYQKAGFVMIGALLISTFVLLKYSSF